MLSVTVGDLFSEYAKDHKTSEKYEGNVIQIRGMVTHVLDTKDGKVSVNLQNPQSFERVMSGLAILAPSVNCNFFKNLQPIMELSLGDDVIIQGKCIRITTLAGILDDCELVTQF